ncbi:hypothetical protein M9Y10_032678 [Tritrichomonas musculus]|uniref:Uncharacterized protein n=1 Tax=Tritrichomonas musculus TaxID=1915356 RepID=A0ABR2GXI1_9EUKA
MMTSQLKAEPENGDTISIQNKLIQIKEDNDMMYDEAQKAQETNCFDIEITKDKGNAITICKKNTSTKAKVAKFKDKKCFLPSHEFITFSERKVIFISSIKLEPLSESKLKMAQQQKRDIEKRKCKRTLDVSKYLTKYSLKFLIMRTLYNLNPNINYIVVVKVQPNRNNRNNAIDFHDAQRMINSIGYETTINSNNDVVFEVINVK